MQAVVDRAPKAGWDASRCLSSCKQAALQVQPALQALWVEPRAQAEHLLPTTSKHCSDLARGLRAPSSAVLQQLLCWG